MTVTLISRFRYLQETNHNEDIDVDLRRKIRTDLKEVSIIVMN